MRVLVVVLLFALPALAGCSESASPVDEGTDDFGDFDLKASETTGVVRGIVIDVAIVPVADAVVRLADIPGFVGKTDFEGRFGFGDVPAGTHILNVTSPLFRTVQAAVTVVAGDLEPALVKIQLERRFDQDPYLEQIQIEGYINCGFSVALSGPCVIDYTQLVYPGGALPILYGITGDVRRFVVPVYDGWQTRINEMVWEPSLGTSQSLSMTISFYNRTTSHSYTGTSGVSPVRHQMDMDPEREHPDWVGPTGQHDYLVFVNPNTSGSGLPVALVLEQRFELFVNTFYYGTPPEDWSFVGGDDPPW